MKREFKTPTIEAKMISTLNSVMDDGILKSAAGPNTGNLTGWTDKDINNSFNAWKGFGAK